jgi:hypothetical protein
VRENEPGNVAIPRNQPCGLPRVEGLSGAGREKGRCPIPRSFPAASNHPWRKGFSQRPASSFPGLQKAKTSGHFSLVTTRTFFCCGVTIRRAVLDTLRAVRHAIQLGDKVSFSLCRSDRNRGAASPVLASKSSRISGYRRKNSRD